MLLALLLRLPDRWLVRLAGGAPLEAGGRTLDPACQLLARRAGGPPLATLPLATLRAASDRGMALMSGRRRSGVATRRLEVPGPGGPVPLRLYRPAGVPAPAPLLLFFHQGGFVIGTPDWCEAFCTLLADVAGCLVASVQYRRAPEHPFPAAHQDARAVLDFALAHAPELGSDPSRIALGGESAGANLTAHLCLEARRRGLPPPRLQLLVYPWLETRHEMASARTYADAWPLDTAMLERFVQLACPTPSDADDPRMNPLRAPDLSGQPLALVHCAGFDPIGDQGRAYAQRLSDAGVPTRVRSWDALPHSFLAMGAVPAALRAQQEIAREVGAALQQA